jgi:multiple sugar transport system permease protein
MKVPLQVVLALLLALFVSRAVRGMGLIRTIIFFPVVTSLVVGAMLWALMYNKDLGLLQSMAGIFGLRHPGFLSNPDLALPSIVLMMVWKEVGFSMIIYVAGLKGIPEMFYDAAAIDGASPLQRFWYITLPLLKPAILATVFIRMMDALRTVDEVWMLTGGGPGAATRYVGLHIWRVVFPKTDYGYGSAMSLLTLYFTIVMCWLLYAGLMARRDLARAE